MPLYTQNSEAELVASLKNKDQQAFSYLYDNYAAALYGVVMRMINQEETAKDLLQEIFIKIWRGMDSYDPAKGRLYTWMLNIARNSAIDVLRSPGFNQEKKISDLENNVNTDIAALSTSIKTDHVGLKQIVDGLKDEYRRIIDLAYFKGYTQEEIARALNIPVGTVKTRARSALIQLKSILK